MSVEKPCPSKSILVGFVSGDLPEPDAKTLESHLSKCDSCGDTVRAMHANDTMVNFVRSAGGQGNLAERVDGESPAEEDALVYRLTQLPSVIEQSVAAQSANVDFDMRVDEVQRLFAAAESQDEIGRVGHYRVLRLLGAGGMGVVFQAEDTKLQRLVALKILRPSMGAAARERFVQEARSAAAIAHDNVITIYDVGQAGPLAYLAMQWLEGETLEQHLHREGKMSPEETARIASEVADGLAAAHAKNLVHRDIKPANIWLESERGRTRILDFGLARIADANPQLTETGMIAGTPAYMSPEQAQGKSVDARTDLFSLGSMMYRMLTGQFPFETSNALATIRSIQQDQPKTPREVSSAVPSILSSNVMRLLEKEAELRPNSAVEVMTALRANRAIYCSPRAAPEVASDSTAQASRTRSAVSLLIAVAVAFCGLYFSPMIYRIVTKQGVIKIETDDPNVSVQVKGDDQVVVLTGANNRITIGEGKYDLQIVGESDSVSLSDDTIVLKTNQTKVVTITVVKGDASVAEHEATMPRPTQSSDGVRYKGETLGHWLQRARTERDPRELLEIVNALGSLGQADQSFECAQHVLQVMRADGYDRMDWRANRTDSNDRIKLNEAARRSLLRMSPDGVVKAMIAEINSPGVGNSRSRMFMLGLLDHPFVDLDGFDVAQDFERLKREYVASNSEFVKAWWTIVDGEQDQAKREWALEFGAWFFVTVSNQDPEMLPLEPTDTFSELMREQLETDNPYLLHAVCTALVKCAPDTPGLAEAIATRHAYPMSRYWLALLAKLGPKAAPATMPLVEALEGNCRAATELLIPQRNFMAFEIVNVLARIGPDAKAALPRLRKLAERIDTPMNVPTTEQSSATRQLYDLLRKPVREAIRKIESDAEDAVIDIVDPVKLANLKLEFRLVAKDGLYFQDQSDGENETPEDYSNINSQEVPGLPVLLQRVHDGVDLGIGESQGDGIVSNEGGFQFILLSKRGNDYITTGLRKVQFVLPPRIDDRGVKIWLDDVGRSELLKLIESNAGSRLAIIVNGRVVAAPAIEDVSPSPLTLSGERVTIVTGAINLPM